MPWQFRHVISDACVTDWVLIPEAGETRETLDVYLYDIFKKKLKLVDVSRNFGIVLLEDEYDNQYQRI